MEENTEKFIVEDAFARIEEIIKALEQPETKLNDAMELYREGVISGGMIPKVECCIEAIRLGVKHVIIMDGRVPHSILMELLTDEGAGTMVSSKKIQG